MKKAVLASLLSVSAAAAMTVSQPAAAENAKEQVIIRSGEQAAIKGSPKYFTGSVRIDPLYPTNNEMRSSGRQRDTLSPAPAPTGISTR